MSISQCTNWETINFDSFEYTTDCPYIIPGATYHTTPQPNTAGPNHTGDYHLYLNFVDGTTDPAFDRPYDVCVGENYRISFFHREAAGGENNTTFNFYDGNNILLSTNTISWTGDVWNEFISPEIIATTSTIRLEIVNNLSNGTDNDMIIDDMELSVCGVSENHSYSFCSQNSALNLYDLFSSAMPPNGTWTGPSVLSNGDLGSFDPTLNTSGTYTYTFASLSPCPTPIGTITVQNMSSINLGNDTTLCAGSSTILNAGNRYDYYQWSTGETTESITVSSDNNYSVEVGVIGSNIVLNGDFESGDVNFTTDYTPGAGGTYGTLSNEGTYAISSSPSLVHNNFSGCSDITSGTGNMYVANGSGIANTNVWCQTVAVDPNTDYLFSAFLTNALNDTDLAQLQFFINNIQIGPIFSPSTLSCDWFEFNETWSSGINTSATLCIKNQNTTTSGNDFALDEITFAPICIINDDINVSIETITINAGQDISFCQGEQVSITANSNELDPILLWSSGETTNEIYPLSSGNYIVTATSQNNCTVTDNVNVIIETTPTALLSATPNVGLAPINIEIDNLSLDGISFEWNFGNGEINTTFDLSSQTQEYLSPGEYLITLISINGNCSDTATQLITVENPIFPHTIDIPNVFTPNDDLVNDYYTFNMTNINTIEVTLTNRRGNIVYSSSDINFKWDGFVNGKKATHGVYFYIYNASSDTDEDIKGHGFFHLQ